MKKQISPIRKYNITLKLAQEETYDEDEILCMMQQYWAISQGWSDSINVFIIEEDESVFYEWNNRSYKGGICAENSIVESGIELKK